MYYSAYGLYFQSEVELPFFAAGKDAEPDVTVRFGSARDARVGLLGRSCIWNSAPGVFRLDVEGVARYLVRAGREILVEPAGGSAGAVRSILLGSVMAACLQQRGIVTLHASAIEFNGRAVLFAGGSGNGKSALAGALVERGYKLLADDVTGIVLAGRCPIALPAYPCLRLWADAVDELSWRKRVRGRTRGDIDKYVVPVDRFATAPLAVGAMFELAGHNRGSFDIQLLPLPHALGKLVRYTYRSRFQKGWGEAGHFKTTTALAKQVLVASVRRPAHPFLLDPLADEIEQYLQSARLPDLDSGRDAGRPTAGTAVQ